MCIAIQQCVAVNELMPQVGMQVSLALAQVGSHLSHQRPVLPADFTSSGQGFSSSSTSCPRRHPAYIMRPIDAARVRAQSEILVSHCTQSDSNRVLPITPACWAVAAKRCAAGSHDQCMPQAWAGFVRVTWQALHNQFLHGRHVNPHGRPRMHIQAVTAALQTDLS